MKTRRAPSPQVRKRARPQHGVARVLSKLGVCSRAEAVRWIAAGRVTLGGRAVRDPEEQVLAGARLLVDQQPVAKMLKRYLLLNKPRGLVVSAHDEKGRATVFDCFAGSNLPHIVAVGRLDRASEGLLLFTNDTAWAAMLTDPAQHIDKKYHVQISVVANALLLEKLEHGVQEGQDFLAVKKALLLRQGERHSWLELTIDEGKNRHLRRLLAAFDVDVLRLVRVAIGPLALGTLAKGAWRDLTSAEVSQLAALKR